MTSLGKSSLFVIQARLQIWPETATRCGQTQSCMSAAAYEQLCGWLGLEVYLCIPSASRADPKVTTDRNSISRRSTWDRLQGKLFETAHHYCLCLYHHQTKYGDSRIASLCIISGSLARLPLLQPGWKDNTVSLGRPSSPSKPGRTCVCSW